MFTWPAVELTEYERQFVRVYKDDKYPGVLRRTYPILLNSVADPLTPLLNNITLSGRVQIARRARVFALTFAGNLGSWRLEIKTASGELMTPTTPQADGPPLVSAMCAGSAWNALSALGDQALVSGMQTPGGRTISGFFGSFSEGPLLLDPNWELAPNETLQFTGTPIGNQATTEFVMTQPAQKLLSIGVHVWEFPGMDGKTRRMGGGPQIVGKG